MGWRAPILTTALLSAMAAPGLAQAQASAAQVEAQTLTPPTSAAQAPAVQAPAVQAPAAQTPTAQTPAAQVAPPEAPKAEVHVPAFTLRYSGFASPEAKAWFAGWLTLPKPPLDASIPFLRSFYGKFNDDRLAEMRRAYDTDVVHTTMGGVVVDVVTARAGVPKAHADKVLINLHGGAFMWGSGSGALVEAMPIAVVGGFKVVTVDYRLAPEHRYPAGSEDAAAVYRELLKSYKPANIGIYGCSAGGVLTAEAVAYFQVHDLPRPGAIGTFCGSGIPFAGDSDALATVADGDAPPAPDASISPLPYLAGVPLTDALAYPAEAPAVLAKFPPTLLITGSRDFAASSEATMARRLAAAGVDAHLFVFDGMPHAFFMTPGLPESQEAYRLISAFFDRELGVKPPAH
jgi:epsilon-lactone hydrolase